ncbi:glycosyltransferase [bacterium]|nr:glycosyltransferase [bacterium]
MEISFFTPTINLKNSNGYGYAGLNIIESLKSLGHQVPYSNPKSPVQLNFAQPEHFKMHKNQYQIGYTPWESTKIPTRWIDMMNACDELWTTSDWCANIFNDNGFNNVKVYPHGIEKIWMPYRRKEKEVIKFLHVGEPAPRKGGQMVVDAFTQLFANNPKYHLTIKAYHNNTTRIYNNIIDRNIIGLPHNVYNNISIITDQISDTELVKLFHDHDVLLYPSYGEGFGFIPLQALATGMPTICTAEWTQYKNYLGPLALKSELIDSPWPFPHEGKMLEPNYKHLLEVMRDVVHNFKAYSGYYFAQASKIHKDYNWIQLTDNAFQDVIKKFS